MPSANPFFRLLSRLSVGRKLMLIYVLDLTAVIFVSSILINEKFIAIDFTRKEIAGNSYVAAMHGGLVEAVLLTTAAGPAGAHSIALGRHAAALAHAEQAHGAGLQSTEAMQALAVGEPVLLSRAEMAEVIERFRSYGRARLRGDTPAV